IKIIIIIHPSKDNITAVRIFPQRYTAGESGGRGRTCQRNSAELVFPPIARNSGYAAFHRVHTHNPFEGNYSRLISFRRHRLCICTLTYTQETFSKAERNERARKLAVPVRFIKKLSGLLKPKDEALMGHAKRALGKSSAKL
ncbi:hypothetical protein TSAR_007669, partial [Trichomalopsis sarcophagae]